MNTWTAESRAKLSASLRGRTIPADVRAKISANHSRHTLGKTLSAGTRQKMSLAKKGRVPWNKGKQSTHQLADEERAARRRRASARVGSLNPCWKGGVTPVRTRLWRSQEYRTWRERIFRESDYSCQLCGVESGGGQAVRLEADHFLIPFVSYLDRLLSQVDPAQLYQAAIADRALWAASGRALCVPCHNTTKRGRSTRGFLKAKSDKLQASRHM